MAELELLSILWFTAPVVIAIIIEALYLLGKVKSRAVVITAFVVLTLAVPVYLSTLMYAGTDAQAGLAVAVMPAYQLAALLLVSVFLAVARLFTSRPAR
jgi:hypothetical protein